MSGSHLFSPQVPVLCCSFGLALATSLWQMKISTWHLTCEVWALFYSFINLDMINKRIFSLGCSLFQRQKNKFLAKTTEMSNDTKALYRSQALVSSIILLLRPSGSKSGSFPWSEHQPVLSQGFRGFLSVFRLSWNSLLGFGRASFSCHFPWSWFFRAEVCYLGVADFPPLLFLYSHNLQQIYLLWMHIHRE